MEYIGIDYGHKIIGLSWGSDVLGLVVPLKPICNFTTFEQILKQLKTVIYEKGCDAIVIGLPIHMNGQVGQRAHEVENFANKLQPYVHLPIHFQDERLSTQAAYYLSGYKTESLTKAKQRKQRGIIDSQSAMIILQDYLDQQKLSTSTL